MNMTLQSQQNNAIEVKDLYVRYGTRDILKKISIDIKQGEILVIMGGSGSGKSTFLRHLLGLEIPLGGTVRLLGKDTNKLGLREMHDLRRQIGVSFQGGALFNSMTVGENVCVPLREHANLDENTMRIMMRMKLEVVNLAGFEDLMPSQLSGGMIKRVALARSIVTDPRLLFFDEPSAGLDPVVSAELDELILKLRDSMGMTIVVVTHELDSAFKIADRITFLDRGHILMTDTVKNIKASNNDRIQRLLNRTPEEADIDPVAYLKRLTGRSNEEEQS